MKKYIINRLTITLALLVTVFSAQSLMLVPAHASFKTDACAGLHQVDSSTDADCGNLSSQGKGVTRLVKSIVNLLSIVVGLVAILMVIVAGFKYVTSNGDSARVGSAKNTLIYALIGLAIAALAQVLVHFVLAETKNATTPCPTNSKLSISDPQCKK